MIKRIFKILLLVVSLGLTIVYMVLIWKLTFGHLVEAMAHRRAQLKTAKELNVPKDPKSVNALKKTLYTGDERVKYYLGYRVMDTIRIEGHFHHIDFDIKPDKRSYCIKCHGDMPHKKVKEVRSFWNMHAFFMACETCHTRFDDPKSPPVYKWYDRETGQIVPSPVAGARPGAYNSKIVPFEMENGSLVRVDSDQRIAFADEYIKVSSTLTELQKTKGLNMIHSVDTKKPYVCADCHQKDKPVLSLKELGYPPERIASIESNEVVGMIDKYKTFFMPDFLKPGQ
jgi:hypothetical protein